MGAGRGIGRELAIHLCQLGVNVACVDINIENCNVTIEKASQGLGVATAYICNVTNKKEVSSLLSYICNMEQNSVLMKLLINYNRWLIL